jgi:hypothetical protein
MRIDNSLRGGRRDDVVRLAKKGFAVRGENVGDQWANPPRPNR